jgi:hypothetical protein
MKDMTGAQKGLSMKQRLTLSLLSVVSILQDIFSRQQKAGKVRKNKHHVHHGPLSKKVVLISISFYWKVLSMVAL